MGKRLESGNICEMMCPSLQDFEYDVSCPVLFAAVGYVSHIADVGPYTIASNPGSVPSSTAEPLAGYLGNLDHFSSCGVASVFSGHAGNPSCYSIGDL
jgi:hypothetical protein